MSKHETRESWLQGAIELATPLFTDAGYKVPKVRVSCGWPVRGGMSKRKRVIGECWSTQAATDKVPQIFISPWLDGKSDNDQGVIPTLVHEVVHAVVGNEEGHNKVFGKCARAVGLEGKLTSTEAGEDLMARIKKWYSTLGDYPHAKLDKTSKDAPSKKQGCRLLKCECKKCGYICRTTKKWLADVGAPLCPTHKTEMAFDKLPEEDDDGGDE